MEALDEWPHVRVRHPEEIRVNQSADSTRIPIYHWRFLPRSTTAVGYMAGYCLTEIKQAQSEARISRCAASS